MVREKFPAVGLIANRDNPGFAVANNQAMRLASGEYVLLLNPDTVVEEDTFDKCIAFMDAHPEAGGLGVKMIDGTGAFLPESKRGFPTPFVAFCKTFGLSRLFPRSRLFNRYHLGYLDPEEVHEVEVLAGAFMLLRRSVLDEIGLLDESFFMYGEDIDLSYRIVRAGYKNYYFPETTIIHYKGESTKRGSLNYVRAFYQAMIIFARKHFAGEQARLFIGMLRFAIYFRAMLTILSNTWRKAYLPLLDGLLIYGGLILMQNFWATYHFRDPDYYQDSPFVYFNAPLYVLIWLGSIYFSGGYDEKKGPRRLIRGLLFGTLLLAAVYGFLGMEYRSSRALILLGAGWALIATIALRSLLQFFRTGRLGLGEEKLKNLVIVGSREESARVQRLLHQARVPNNFIGTVAPRTEADASVFLSGLNQLREVVMIYKIDELIFCSRDLSAQDIMYWMTTLGPAFEYKIAPEESLTVIGSSSKHTAGELYTIDIQFNIDHYMQRRNKRLLDLVFSLLLLVTFPLQWPFVRSGAALWRNLWRVLIGRRTWVGYIPNTGQADALPPLRPGILSPLDGLRVEKVNLPTRQRLNVLYAKDYHVSKDLEVLWRGYRAVGSW